MPDLVLYKKDTCPFCIRVLSFAQDAGIKLETRDIVSSPEDYQTLVDKGGKAQVPCLFINGEPLYESADIISYLKEVYEV